MSDVADLVARAWRDGVGPDDVSWLRALLGRAEDPSIAHDRALIEVQVFGAIADVANGVAVTMPNIAHPPAAAALAAAGGVLAGCLTRAVDDLEKAVDALALALAAIATDDPNGAAARAWADFALGELAVSVADPVTAVRRFEAAAASAAPVALRISALLRLSSLAVARLDPAAAGILARRALALAEGAGRPAHAGRARLATAMFAYMTDDVAGARRLLAPAVATGDIFARILLSELERAGAAMAILADGLRIATERQDPVAYLMCILVGARRYVRIGREADALVTLSAGIVQLSVVAPELAEVLAAERSGWKAAWPADRYQTAERQAFDGLG